MNRNFTIQKELNELNSNLPAALPPEVYSVPQGYFEGFAASVLAKIKGNEVSATDELESLSPLLSGLSRKMPFSVPEGYFNDLTTQLSGLIQEEEVPSIILQADRKMPQTVPEGYFDTLSSEVLSKVVPKQQAKVISFGPVRWMRYAAAAVVAGIIALGGVLYLTNQKGSTIDPNKKPQEWVASKLNSVSNKELEDFIKSADAKNITGTETASNKQVSHAEVHKLLNDVSDNELDVFLSQLPSDNELSAIN